MAVTLTVNDVAAGLRIIVDPAGPVEEPYATILCRSLGVATALIEGRAPNADEVIQNQAAIRICGWLYDEPPNGHRSGGTSAWYDSGAAALLAPQVERIVESV